jgi:hypothetical protein
MTGSIRFYGIILLGYVLALTSLSACQPPEPEQIPTETLTDVTRTPKPTRTPRPTYTLSPTYTPFPTSTVGAVANPTSELLKALPPYITGAPELVIGKSITEPVDGYFTFTQMTAGYSTALIPWVERWLRQFQKTAVGTQLALKEFDNIHTTILWCSVSPCEQFVVGATFNVKPANPQETVWAQDFNEIDQNGWIQHDGLVLYFYRQGGDVFKLATVGLNRSFYFSYSLGASRFQGLSDWQIINQLMPEWFDLFVSDDVCPDSELEDYTIDSIEPIESDGTSSTFVIHFSTKWPASAYAERPYVCNRHWSESWFSGTFIGDDTEWLHNSLRYVGIRHNADKITFEALEGKGPAIDRFVRLDQLESDTPDGLAKVLMPRVMPSYYVGPHVTSYSVKLLDYKFESAEIYELEEPSNVAEDYFGLVIHYSGLPYQYLTRDGGCPGWACDGDWNKETGWVDNLFLCLMIERLPDGYEFLYHNSDGCYPPPWSP